MKLSYLAVALGVAAAMTSISSHAGDHRKEARNNHRVDSGMQAVAIATTSGQPGHGWRYFADERKGRAVVISPGGDYFYSHGNGLALVFKATGTVAAVPPTFTADADPLLSSVSAVLWDTPSYHLPVKSALLSTQSKSQ